MQKLKKASEIMLSALVVITLMSMTWAGLRFSQRRSAAVSAQPYVTEPAEIPENAFVIVIDAGHGGFDCGATGSRTGVEEAGLNLKVARLLADELLSQGYYVIMTRENDEALADTKNEDMKIRKQIMQLDCVDLVISVHMNKFKDSSVNGPMVFYMKNSAEGKALAESVINSLCVAEGRQPRQANPEDLFVLRVPYAPSILVECGFLSNGEDEAKLCDEKFQALLAKAIAKGVSEYINSSALSQGG